MRVRTRSASRARSSSIFRKHMSQCVFWRPIYTTPCPRPLFSPRLFAVPLFHLCFYLSHLHLLLATCLVYVFPPCFFLPFPDIHSHFASPRCACRVPQLPVQGGLRSMLHESKRRSKERSSARPQPTRTWLLGGTLPEASNSRREPLPELPIQIDRHAQRETKKYPETLPRAGPSLPPSSALSRETMDLLSFPGPSRSQTTPRERVGSPPCQTPKSAPPCPSS